MSIIDKLVTDMKRVINFTDERDYLVVAEYFFITYQVDVFGFVPPLHIRGTGDGSEITCGELVTVICNNPIWLGYATTPALIQTIKQKELTLLIDSNGVAKINKNSNFCEIISVSNKQSGTARWCNKRGEVIASTIHCPKIFIGGEEIADPDLKATLITVHMKKSPIPLERFKNIKKDFEYDQREIISFFKKHNTFKTDCSNFQWIEGIDGYEELRWRPILTIAGVLDSIGETNALFERLLGLARDNIRTRQEEKFFSDIKTRVLYLTLDFIKNNDPDAFYPAEQIRNHVQEHGGIKMKIEQVGRILNGCEGLIKERVSQRVPWETPEEKKNRLKNIKDMQGTEGEEYNSVPGDGNPEIKKRLKVCYQIDKKALEDALSECGDISRFVREEN